MIYLFAYITLSFISASLTSQNEGLAKLARFTIKSESILTNAYIIEDFEMMNSIARRAFIWSIASLAS